MQTIKAAFVGILFTSFILGTVAFAINYSKQAAAETAANTAALEEALFIVAFSADSTEVKAYKSIARDKAEALNIPLSTCNKIIKAAQKRNASKIDIHDLSHSMHSVVKVTFN
jgi:hypothetical protein